MVAAGTTLLPSASSSCGAERDKPEDLPAGVRQRAGLALSTLHKPRVLFLDDNPERAKAAARLRKAVAAEPFFVAGTDRFDTVVMEALRERAFIKTGAEGVYCAALPEVGLGIALKIEDGAGRAAETAMAALLARS